jgi:hypothetical protein
MGARGLTFGTGERVRAWGELFVDTEGEWLGLPHTDGLALTSEPKRRSPRSIRLVGAAAAGCSA